MMPRMTDSTGPPEAEAGGILTIDLAAIVANWRALGAARRRRPMRRRGQGRRLWLRHRAGRAARSRRPAARRSSSPIWPRRGASRAVAPDAAIYVLNGLHAGHRARPIAEADLRPVIGSLAELAEWDAFRAATRLARRRRAARRHRHEPARISVERGRRARASRAGNDPGIALVMSHFACAEEDHPLNAQQIERFRAMRALFPGIPGSLANSSGIFLGARCASRPGAARRRALRRQSDARQAEPDAAGGRAQGPHRAGARRRAGRDRRLRRDLDGEAPDPARHRLGRLRRRLSCAPRARATRGPAPRRSSPASAVRSPAASRWT